jgi:hypothetical protein
LITDAPALEGGVKLSLVLEFVMETLPEPDVTEAEVIVAPAGAYAKVAAPVSKGLMVTVVPATADLVSGQAANGENEMSSKKFPAVLEIALLTDSKANRVIA